MWFIGAPVSLPGDAGDVVVPSSTDLRVIRPGDRHLTLLFLGKVPVETVMECWGDLPPLVLPPQSRPLRWERFGRSAIALAISDDDQLLRGAADACHDTAAPLLELPRPSVFRPHVTMARVPRRARPPTAAELQARPVPGGPLDVDPATLFRSRTEGSGDRYEVVQAQPRSERR